MERIITISGKARSGKDTLGLAFKRILEAMGKRVVIVHYADFLKMIATNYYGWDGEKNDAGRTLLQYLGTDVARKVNPNIWVDVVMMFVRAFKNEFDVFIIPDTRFPNEVSTPKLMFPDYAISIRVSREKTDEGLTKEQQSHPSETALDDYKKFDYDILMPEGINNVVIMADIIARDMEKLLLKREEEKETRKNDGRTKRILGHL